MKTLLNDVRAFHEATDNPVLSTPTFVHERAFLRQRLLKEEWLETDAAIVNGDLVGVADGLADLIYVAVGTALEFGIPLDRIWDEVHRSNMAKIDPETGKVTKRTDGKVLKPDGWVAPDIQRVLYESTGS